jgi:3-dehydroquinate synthase/shikimate kinase/3-dehydroquinate synthase
MKPINLKIKTKQRNYKIIIGSNIIKKISSLLNENLINFEKCLLVVDKNISTKKISEIKKSLKRKKVFTYYFKANEKNKNQINVSKIVEIMLSRNFTRHDCIISIGGGITGDVSGFAASIFKRGLKFINVPTTLLAQVDSSIGGKTGINTRYGKNLIGSFYQPNLVISDIKFLQSLPKREITCGYGEILKHAIIANKEFFIFLHKNSNKILNLKSPYIEKSIYESCKIKKFVVEKDENEKNLRKILNFGHTFAHAYEASLGFSKKLNHGEAVILGMNTALKFSHNKNFLKKHEYDLVVSHMIKSKLPNSIKNYFSSKDVKKIISFMIKDKKNITKNINLILLKKIGSPIINMAYKEKYLKIFLNNELKN